MLQLLLAAENPVAANRFLFVWQLVRYCIHFATVDRRLRKRRGSIATVFLIFTIFHPPEVFSTVDPDREQRNDIIMVADMALT